MSIAASRIGLIALVAAIVEVARDDAHEAPKPAAKAPKRRGGYRRPGGARCPAVTRHRPHQRRVCAAEWLEWLEGTAAAIQGDDPADLAEELAMRVLAHAA